MHIRNEKENKEEHHIKTIVSTSQQKDSQPLEGNKKFVRFFSEYIVEVKNVLKHGSSESKGEQLCIYDFETELVLYWTQPVTAILQVEIENDAIYYLAENKVGENS